MNIATRSDTPVPAPRVVDSHDLIRVLGIRENNLKDISVEIPKRRLTVFTGVSGSGKSSLVFGTIAAESQRLINETLSISSSRRTYEMAQKPDKSTTDETTGFTADERAAMKARARELKAEARESKNRAEGERAVLAAIAGMPDPDRALAERFHAIVTASAPSLSPKTWYGMPAYARDGKVVCFFQAASKFNSRYATLGFNDAARLDDGVMWPTSFALTALTDDTEARITALVKKAVS